MFITNEKDIIALIHEDKWMMELLKCAKSLNLPDWWICAGFVRSKVWDKLHGFDESTSIPDIDVIYFDRASVEERIEKNYEEALNRLLPTVPWSVKNQARMHTISNSPPYTSSVDALAKFPETATALGVKLNDSDDVLLAAPHGIHDVVNLIVKPTPYFCESKDRMLMYETRVRKKNWRAIWNNVELMDLGSII